MKKLLHIQPEPIFHAKPETGMGFHLIDATIDSETQARTFVLVAGRDFAINRESRRKPSSSRYR